MPQTAPAHNGRRCTRSNVDFEAHTLTSASAAIVWIGTQLSHAFGAGSSSVFGEGWLKQNAPVVLSDGRHPHLIWPP